jgi:hypothetical protein
MGNAPDIPRETTRIMFDFFTQPDPVFGRISWTMGLVWFATLVLSVYLVTGWRESNAARRRFWRRVAIGTLVIGGLGMLALVLNFYQIPPFNIRAWIYLFSVATLAYWGWAAYFYFKELPSQAAAAARPTTRAPIHVTRADAQRGAQQGRSTIIANGKAPERPARQPRPEATTSRREARRDRKRRGR